MPVKVVTTVNGLCKRCYSCIRNCPAKAIKVVDGQAAVVPELCIGCGHCVQVCSQNAKRISSGAEKTRESLKYGKSIACLAPSFVVQYYRYNPGQIVHAVSRLGFDEVWEVACGARLVANRYQQEINTEKPAGCFISTVCPAVVTMVEKHYPDLIPYLMPVVSPMIALGRYLKGLYGPDCRVVFIGPCVAKKEEAENPMVSGAIDGVLTFPELDQMLQEEKIDPDTLSPRNWDSPAAGMARLFPLAGGLLKNIGQQYDPLNYEIIQVEGQQNCLDFFNGLRGKKPGIIKFADVLFCEGCINGPAINCLPNYMERQQLVARFTQKDITVDNRKEPALSNEELDLQRSFRNRSPNLPVPSANQLQAVLTELGKFAPEDELNCGACGYGSCRGKATAVFRGLAESKMCLPYLIANLESHNFHLRNRLTGVYRVENIIGNAPSMQHILEIIKKVAPTDSTVLIRGKSGTGKELIAQALHQKSLRAEKNFVSINCAALPENLIESELFGHVKGAFTGAVKDKKGLFEEANGGTLFLDEIGEITPRLQAKLLRVLQEEEFLKIGETQPRTCDVRIIAASNRNLEEMLKRKLFREDLFFRLSVLVIDLPDLRERAEDIPALVKFFLEKFNQKHQKNIDSVSAGAMKNLMEAPWPGNIRELANAIERAVILCAGSEIRNQDLPPSIGKVDLPNRETVPQGSIDYNEAVMEYKKKLIVAALKSTNGVQAEAARRLGIGRSTLSEMVKKYRLEV